MKFSDKIMTLRKRKGWSQEELANQLDVSRQAIYKWESGLTTPELEKIKRLTEIFDTTFEDLLNDEKELVLDKKEVEPEPTPEADSQPKVKENKDADSAPKAEPQMPKEKQKSKRARIIALIVAGAILFMLLTTVLPVCLILRNAGIFDGQEDESSQSEKESSSSQVIGANCAIHIMTGASEDIYYRVKLTKGQGFKLEIPEKTRDCAEFLGYFLEDGTQITNSEGSSLVSWQGEQRYTLYPHYEYKIKTVEDLQALQTFSPVRRQDTYSGVRITLENDLDLSGVKDWEPLRIYACLDGKGHTIKNLTSTKGGLFGDIYGAGDKYVKNLSFENVKITINDIPGPGYFHIGILAGWFQGDVESVTVKSGKITVAKDLENSVIYNEYSYHLIVDYVRGFENCESNATIELK
ncbi:MAG: helix-turn-helix domain-containing protein [Ruminococcaceae bacterium]|nr:helix-turn-helix domain-containing protein [Oscillospiraceae bacterium]